MEAPKEISLLWTSRRFIQKGAPVESLKGFPVVEYVQKSELETQAKAIERLEAENKLLEKCRGFYGDRRKWSKEYKRQGTLVFQSRRELSRDGGKLARETAKKIEAIKGEK